MGKNDTSDKAILQKIGKAIQFWRKLKGHDQRQFSNDLETARSYVSRLETGNVGVSLSRIKEVADVLKVSPYTLLRGTPGKEEVSLLLELYRNKDYAITKFELENLFCARFENKGMTRDFYLNVLAILRSGIYSRELSEHF